MGDGGILSTLGYKNMWPKLRDVRSHNQEYPMKSLQFCCEKRVPTSVKIWVGNYCSMAMAAHAHDLIAEALWTETSLHYGRSDVLKGKAQELREALGDGYNLDEKDTRKKIVDFANNYANMFPCSDSRQILMECFRMWVTQKGIGGKCNICIEKPQLPDHEPENDRFYPPTLLPPVSIPESLMPRESPYATRGPPTKKQGPFHVLGTNDLKTELGIEPDLMSCCVMSARGDLQNKSTIPCIYQQWTWCTRTKDEMNKRRWHASRTPNYSCPKPTFVADPMFTTEGFPDARFSLLNFRVYDYLNLKRETQGGPSRFNLRRGGTAIREYVQVDADPMVDLTSNHDDISHAAMNSQNLSDDTTMNDVQ